jgi:hypothetical protein
MTTGAIIRLVLQALVFIAWAFLTYRMLVTLRTRSEQQTGQASGGMLAQFKHWMKSDEDKQDRKTLVFLTFVLVAMNLMNALGTAT